MGMMKFASYRVTHNLLLGRWNYCFVESQVLFRICSSPSLPPQITVVNRVYHYLSRFEIAGAKRISRHLSTGDDIQRSGQTTSQ